MNLKRYIGDRKFYADGTGNCGTDHGSEWNYEFCCHDRQYYDRAGRDGRDVGVAVVNQLLFVFNLSVFGMLSGAGIFGAQFFGSGNTEGFRNTFRFKLLSCFLLTLVGILLFLTQGERLIMLYLHDESGSGDCGLPL